MAKKKHTINHELTLLVSHLRYKRFSRGLRILGPGLVTGAADDDPSGIATYSQAGAMYGFGLLWMFIPMFALLVSVQETCARIGAVTGSGLAKLLKRHYSKPLLYTSVMLVIVANTINIGADLSAMAAAVQLLTPAFPLALLTIFFAIACIALQLFIPYKTYARVLKWLAITLFAYPITAFLIGQDWGQVLLATITPSFSLDPEYLFILVGVLGTTISPYLFFWNTSEVVEDEITTKRLRSANAKPRLSKKFLRSIKRDNIIGMSLASITAWFIVIVCGSVLYSQGIHNIDSAADAARALEPLVQGVPNAGLIAKLLFSVGIIGIGLLAVPVLAGSSSYALSEAIGLKEGFNQPFKKAHGFYTIIVLAILAGLGFNALGIDPIHALLFTAVFNAIAAIPLLVMIIRVANNEQIMGEYKNKRLSNIGLWSAFVLMLLAAIVLIISQLATSL